ncbi:hypothetical protein [Arthrobacter psychrolactophilus]
MVVVGERLSPLGWSGLGIIAAALVVLAIAPATTELPVKVAAPSEPALSPQS